MELTVYRTKHFKVCTWNQYLDRTIYSCYSTWKYGNFFLYEFQKFLRQNKSDYELCTQIKLCEKVTNIGVNGTIIPEQEEIDDIIFD
ncbi:hypothetical protein A3Q56_07294 [Intoshia linei]|uniref:Uncharacterized protein n=1 Tax=Intoshia linei TaxID=1819745 RepID=A0A177AUV5_9BILA|nr:hypothetical protein A3Q56_07294 [Intoshia linei]